MDEPDPQYTREQMIAFLAAWIRKQPGLTLSAARAEGREAGFTVGRREYEEARRMATGSPIHPEHGGETTPLSAVHAAAGEAEAAAPEREPVGVVAPESDEPRDVVATERRRRVEDVDETTGRKDARTFAADFVRANPTASFKELKAAMLADGYPPPTPIGYGLARKAAALPPMAPQKAAERASIREARDAGRKADADAAHRGRASPMRADDFEKTRRILDQREKLFRALKTIDQIVKRARGE